MSDKVQPNLGHLPYGGAHPIQDAEQLSIIAKLLQSYDPGLIADTKVNAEFLQKYINWLTAGQGLIGLNQFKYAVYSNGTTQAFDAFYLRHRHRRFRIYEAEYSYHRIAFARMALDWAPIDGTWEANDALIFSVPFANTGNWQDQSMLLNLPQRGLDIDIPVLIDMAYLGTTGPFVFDLRLWNSAEDIVFSLSKVFPVPHYRIGMRLSRYDYDDGMFVYHKANYTNRFGAWLGAQLLDHYAYDWLWNKYRDQQTFHCAMLGIEPSNSVLFGVDRDSKWPEYNRGGNINRLFIGRHYV